MKTKMRFNLTHNLKIEKKMDSQFHMQKLLVVIDLFLFKGIFNTMEILDFLIQCHVF